MKSNKRKSIKNNIKNMLWLKAAGRCEFRGCNKCLWQDDLTKNPCNLANIAHIVSDSPNGPRGDKTRSPLLADKIENLMLLCPDHHNLVDSNAYVSKYPVEILQDMKNAHERRIALVTSLQEEREIHTIVYSSKIGSTSPLIDANSINKILLPDYYPAEATPIEIEWSGVRKDDSQKYWEDEELNLVECCKERILTPAKHWHSKKIALFALAPMPLLVKLGTILNDKLMVEVFQKHRNPDSWEWSGKISTNYIINQPRIYSKTPVLVFSLSYDITDRIKSRYGKSSSIWEFRIREPDNDFLKSKKQLHDFRKKVYEVLAIIKAKSKKNELNVFMSMPVACAIEFGRAWMEKADLKLNLYDYNTKYNQDELALTICQEKKK